MPQISPSPAAKTYLQNANEDVGLAFRRAAADGATEAVVGIHDSYREAGLDVNAVSSNQRSALEWSLERGHYACAKAILQFPETNKDTVKGLLPRFPKLTELLDIPSSHRSTPVESKQTPRMQGEALLQQANQDCNLAFRRAAASGQDDALWYLYERFKSDKAFDLNATSTNGHTALMWGAANGHPFSVRFLLGCEGIDTSGAAQVAKNAEVKSVLSSNSVGVHGNTENNLRLTWRLRFPHVYLALLDMLDKGTVPANAKVLVLGPGMLDDGTSPQLSELRAILPDAAFDVVDKSDVNCANIEAGKYLQVNYYQDGLAPFFKNTPFTRDVGALQERLRQGLETLDTKKQQNLQVVCSPIENHALQQNTYDVIVSTYCLSYAAIPMMTQDDLKSVLGLATSVMSSLKKEGVLFADRMAAQCVFAPYLALTRLSGKPGASEEALPPPVKPLSDQVAQSVGAPYVISGPGHLAQAIEEAFVYRRTP